MKQFCLAITMGLILAGFFPEVARAGIGTDIGVYFPVGGGGKRSVAETVGYASFTVGQVAQELTVEKRRGRLLLEFTVTNDGDEPYIIEHQDGQEYDFIVLDKHGRTLYRWSDGMAFTQAVTSSVVEAHKSVTYKAEIAKKEYKAIRDDAVLVVAFLKDTPYTLSAAAPSEIVTEGGSAAVRGAIRIGIGNGHYPYWD